MTRSHRDDEDDQNGPDDERPGTRIDISFSVTDLLSDLLGEAKRDSNRRSLGQRPSGRPSRASPAAQRRAGGSADAESSGTGADAGGDYRVDGYRDGDELTVVADLGDTGRGDVTAGIDPNRTEFVVAVGERVAGRVSLPWDPVEVVDTSFNNGVLQVRIRPIDDAAE